MQFYVTYKYGAVIGVLCDRKSSNAVKLNHSIVYFSILKGFSGPKLSLYSRIPRHKSSITTTGFPEPGTIQLISMSTSGR